MTKFDESLADQIFSPVDVFGFGIFLIPSANSANWLKKNGENKKESLWKENLRCGCFLV